MAETSIKTRCTDEQKWAVQYAAEQAGMNVSDFIRAAVKRYGLMVLDRAEKK